MKKVTLLLLLSVCMSFNWAAAQNDTAATAQPLVIGGTACTGNTGGPNSGDPTGNDGTDGNLCSANYSGGDDFIFSYTATTADQLVLNLEGGTWSGIMVTDGDPVTGNGCLGFSGSSSGTESLTTNAMTIGITYYIHISTWPTPQSVGQFCLDAALQTPALPPANDDCSGAIALTVNADQACGTVTSGTIEAATASAEDPSACGGTEDDDVWYSFVATSTSHSVDLQNVAGSTTDMYHSVWSGACGTPTVLTCSDADSSVTSGLTIGNTYLLRVYTWTATAGQTSTFDVCIGTPPNPPANDECATAEALTVNADLSCGTVTSGTIESATASAEDTAACSGTEDDDVWYSFVATDTTHEISLVNVAGSTTDLYHSLWEGACGSLTLVAGSCSDPNASTASGLTIGNTYYLRVYTWTGTSGQTTTFDVCIGTNPPPPVNSDCATSIAATINAFGSCAVTSSFDNTSGTDSGVTGSCESADGTEPDVWYDVTTNAQPGFNIEVSFGAPNELSYAVYDACAGTELACADGTLTSGLNAVLGLAPATAYKLQFWTETGDVAPFTICLSDIECVPTTVTTSTVVPDCDNAEYSVDIEVTAINDGVNFTDGTDTWAVVLGTNTVGPFATGTTPTISIDHGATTSCNYNVGSFAYDDCPTVVTCGSTTTDGFCYDSNDVFTLAYTADTPANSLQLDFTAGVLEPDGGGTYDDLVIYDGTDDTGVVIYDSDVDGGDLGAAANIVAASGNIYMEFSADFSVSCVSDSATQIPVSYDITCVSCTPAVVDSYTVVEDCANNQYTVDIVFTDEGPAFEIDTFTGPGSTFGFTALTGALTYSIGPFPAGEETRIEIVGFSACDFVLDTVVDACPPANDECANAIALTVEPFGTCTPVTYDLTDATASPEDVGSCEFSFPGGLERDIWFTFTTGALGGVTINSSNTIAEAAVYDACGGTEIACISALATGDNTITGLTPATTYVLQIWTETFNADTFDMCLTDLECIAAEVTSSTVIEDCGNSEFSVDVVVANVNSSSNLVAGSNLFGPYPMGTPVTITAEHGATTSCDFAIGTFDYDVATCPQIVACGVGLTDGFCYDSNDLFTRTYTADTPGNSLSMTFTAGTLEPNGGGTYDDMILYDGTDASGTVLFNSDVSGGTMTGVSVLAASGSIFMTFDADGSNSCVSAGQTALSYDLACVPCIPATFDNSQIVEDCGAGTFNVLVEFSSNGNATHVSDGTNIWPISVGGGATAGPFTTGTVVTLDVLHPNAACDFTLAGTFEYDDCPISVDCGTGLLGEGFCYADNDLFTLSYASDTPGSGLLITFTAGILEESAFSGDTWDDLAIYDGTDATGTLLYDSNDGIVGNNDLTGFTFVAPSGNMFITFDADGSGDCVGDPGLLPVAYDMTCVSCDSAVLDTTTVTDTCGGTNEFSVQVDFTSVGDATDVTDGTNTYAIVGTSVTAGPYASGTTVTLDVVHTDALCDYSLGDFSVVCPPANDDFADAIAISCGDTVIGNTAGASLDEDDAPDQAGFDADVDSPNVWYTMTGNGQTIDLDTCLDGTDFDTEILVYTGTSGNLTLVASGYDDCTGTNSDYLAQASFLSTPGTQYHIVVEGYNVGSVGNFEMSVTCTGPIGAYVYDNGWVDDPNGTTTTNDIIIVSGDATINANTECNTVTVNPGAGLTVDTGITLTPTAGLSLESSSTSYSSLILDGTVAGTMTYDRHVNINGSGTTGSNDLVSAPLTGEAFNTFATANPNILNNGTLYLFGPFEKAAGTFVTWAGTETSTLDAGVGYRAATSDNSTVRFTGTAESGVVNNDIINGGTNNEDWNLIGNPYPSYMNVWAFLGQDTGGGFDNIDLMVPATAAIYGYDGSALNGWTVYNFATTLPSTVIAPGQGFFISARADRTASNDIVFDPSMRRTGNTDDFIAGRNAELTYVKLSATTDNDAFGTDIYFNNNASLGFDLGYDAALWDAETPEDFAIYSHLAEGNQGKAMALQAVNMSNLDDVVIPLGVNAKVGEAITFSILDMTLPASVKVYLEDTVENKITLLNDSDYVVTPNSDLSGTGRFFLRTSNDELSTIDGNLDNLDIFTLKASSELVINGELLNNNTMLNLYDIQGRLVLSTKLDEALIQNRIDVSNINSGVYIATVSNNSQEKTKKVIID